MVQVIETLLHTPCGGCRESDCPFPSLEGFATPKSPRIAHSASVAVFRRNSSNLVSRSQEIFSNLSSSSKLFNGGNSRVRHSRMIIHRFQHRCRFLRDRYLPRFVWPPCAPLPERPPWRPLFRFGLTGDRNGAVKENKVIAAG